MREEESLKRTLYTFAIGMFLSLRWAVVLPPIAISLTVEGKLAKYARNFDRYAMSVKCVCVCVSSARRVLMYT